MSASSIKLTPDWKEFLLDEFSKTYMLGLKAFLTNEKNVGKIYYPTSEEIFSAFNSTPIDKVKVIIIGQDPYHGQGQAHGLSFSVKDGVRVPPSLQNIYKELAADMGCSIPQHGNLTAWAAQGVLLLNAVLTVRANEPASHQGIGWEQFTDAAIKKLQDTRRNLVFVLWGKFAQSKANMIDFEKHLILKAAHPSPFSAHQGFFGCRHFSLTNEYLIQNKLDPINWQL